MSFELGAGAKAFMTVLGITTMAAACNTVLSPTKRTLKDFLRGLVLAGFAGIMAALLLENFEISESYKGFIIGLVAFSADPLLLAMLRIVEYVGENPKELVNAVLDYLFRRGGGKGPKCD